MERHIASNLYTERTSLKNMASTAVVPENTKDDLLHYAEKGQKRFENFVKELIVEGVSCFSLGFHEEVEAESVFKLERKN